MSASYEDPGRDPGATGGEGGTGPEGAGAAGAPPPPPADEPATAPAGAPPEVPSLFKRVLDVFVSPASLFDALRAKPVWGGALLLGALLVVVSAVVVPTELYEEMMREQIIQSGQEMPEGFEMSGMIPKIFGAIGGFIWWMIFSALIAGVVTLVFGFMLGDEGRFKQYLSVTTHAILIMAVSTLLLTPLRIMSGDLQMSFSVGTFLVFLEEGTFLRTMLGFLDLFMLWSFAVLGLGVSRMDDDRGAAGPIVFLLGVAVALAAVFAVIMPGT